MKTYNYTQSQKLFNKAADIIPGGVYGHSTPAVNIPPDAFPFYINKSKGALCWDIDGNEFIDYLCAYGPMVLGYNNELVNNAAMEQMKEVDLTMCGTPKMVELAEYLVDTVPIADWAFFAKNGGDITNYSTMIARAATGRKKIVAISGGYHGVAPWMQSLGHAGVLEDDHLNVIRIPWNDVGAFQKVIDENPGDIAGFIATPYHVPTYTDSELPLDGYWKSIEAKCRKNGIVLILDDIRHGFRLDMGGSGEYYGFKPDLICFGKALANGHMIAALVGTESLKTDVASVFYTGSFWLQAAPMAASLACLKELARLDAPKKMIEIGEKVFGGIREIGKNYGYDLKVSGEYSLPYIRITNDVTMMLHQEWCAECAKRGAYIQWHHNLFISMAHDEAVINKTHEIADEAFQVLKKKYGDQF